MKFLTFDLGTTLYKVALFDDVGRLLALERAIPPIEHPQPQWAEVDPKRFVEVLVDGVRKLRESVNLGDVAAVSFATQANSFTLLDERGQPIVPFILWSDQRAGELRALAKVQWLAWNQPQVFEHAHQLSFISDYLCGSSDTEAGVAGLSGALDLRSLRWKPDALAKYGAERLRLPTVRRAGTDLGLFARAQQFGLPTSCRLVMGCLDQYAGAIGTGTVEPGRACETTGTVLAAVRCVDHFRDDLPRGVIQGPGFDENRCWQMSFSSTSANLLEWYRNQLPDQPSFAELTRLAETAPASDLIIEPYDDRGSIESSFRHIRADHSPGQVVRAIMQRVAQSLKDQLDQLCGSDRPSEIRSAGGAARNDYWLQMKADALRVPVVAMECQEPTSLGAAMLAARSMGLGTMAELADRWVRVRRRFDPKPQP